VLAVVAAGAGTGAPPAAAGCPEAACSAASWAFTSSAMACFTSGVRATGAELDAAAD